MALCGFIGGEECSCDDHSMHGKEVILPRYIVNIMILTSYPRHTSTKKRETRRVIQSPFLTFFRIW